MPVIRRCDVCEEWTKGPEIKRDWLTISLTRAGTMGEKQGVVCSVKCLRTWLDEWEVGRV